jgi:hypothetical protein
MRAGENEENDKQRLLYTPTTIQPVIQGILARSAESPTNAPKSRINPSNTRGLAS